MFCFDMNEVTVDDLSKVVDMLKKSDEAGLLENGIISDHEFEYQMAEFLKMKGKNTYILNM
jgi:hypothetical protein